MSEIPTSVPAVPVADLANRYVKESGWMPLFTIVADRAAKAWTQFEMSAPVNALRVAVNNLKRATASPDALKQKWEGEYRQRLEVAIRDFRGMVREAFVAQKKNAELRAEAAIQHQAFLEQARLDLAKCEERHAEAKANLDLEIIGLGGVPECQIHKPKEDTRAMKAIKLAGKGVAAAAIVAVEMVIGRDAIASRSNPLVGTVTVAAMAIFTFVLIHTGMANLRGLVASWGARRRFKRANKAGLLPKGARLFPYPSSKTLIALSSTAVILGSTFGLLGYRIMVALKAEGSVASETAGDVFGPFVLVTIVIITAIGVYALEHDYTEAQYAEVERLRKDVIDAKAAMEAKRAEVSDLEQPREFEPADQFQAHIDTAKGYYNAQMDEQEQAVRDEVTALENQRVALFSGMATYERMFPLYNAAALEAMNTLIGAVDDHENAAGNEEPALPTDDERQKSRTLFGEKATASLAGNGEFVESLIHVSFSPTFPTHERQSDFESIIEEVEADINAPDEVVAAPEPPAPPPAPTRRNAGTV